MIQRQRRVITHCSARQRESVSHCTYVSVNLMRLGCVNWDRKKRGPLPVRYTRVSAHFCSIFIYLSTTVDLNIYPLLQMEFKEECWRSETLRRKLKKVRKSHSQCHCSRWCSALNVVYWLEQIFIQSHCRFVRTIFSKLGGVDTLSKNTIKTYICKLMMYLDLYLSKSRS